MIKIQPGIMAKLRKAQTADDLKEFLQMAIELEHSTIPPYLTAKFSLQKGSNEEIDQVIYSIVQEEMLHMTIAANILNAMGGSPAINTPDFIPNYPGPLPMNIGDSLVVGLEKYSKEVVKNVFMEIEEPEDPLEFPGGTDSGTEEEEEFNTIGEFYMAIQEKIRQLPGGDNLPGSPQKQVTSSFFPADELFPIHTKTDAINAIDIILEQGEGTSTMPTDEEGDIAHYYRFEELYVGKRLVMSEGSYAYDGAAIPFDPATVYNIFPNTKASMLAEGTNERRFVDDFNAAYSRLLNGLHVTFNGQPDFLDRTLGLMYDVKLQGERLCATPFPGKEGITIGPPFEYVPTTL